MIVESSLSLTSTNTETKTTDMMSEYNLVLMETSGLLERRHVNARQRPLAGKGSNLITELLHLEVTLVALRSGCSNTNEVLEELRFGLLLEEEGELNRTVQEIGNDFDVLVAHVAGCKGGCAETNTTGNLSGCVTRNGVL